MTFRHPAARALATNVAAALLALGAVAALPSARAGWVEDRDGKTIIHVKLWQLPDPSRTDTPTRADVAAVREFVRRFPKIFAEKYRDKYKANPAKYGRHNWDDVRIDLARFEDPRWRGAEHALRATKAKVSADVLYVNFRLIHSYVQQGFLCPLDLPGDGYVAGMTQEEQAFRIHSKIWPVIRRRGPKDNKHVWAIPWGGTLGKVVWYRKKLFDAAKLPYPKNDWTWDDFYRICKKLTDPARGIYGVRFGTGKHESWYWTTFLWSAGGHVMARNPKSGAWRWVFDSREGAVALDFYIRLCTEPWTDALGRKGIGYAYKEQDAGEKWERGEIAMRFMYIDDQLVALFDTDVIGMVPVPVGPTGVRAAELNSRMMGIFSGIKDPVVRDAAWEYIRFYDSLDALRIKVQVMIDDGIGRFVHPKYLRMFGHDRLLKLAPKGWATICRIALDTGVPEPHGRNAYGAYAIMTPPLLRAEELARRGQLPKDREKRLDVLQRLLRKAAEEANRSSF